MKKVLSLVLVILMTVTILAACDGNSSSSENNEPAYEVNFGEAKKFSIVRAESVELEVASKVFRALRDNLNAKLTNVDDTETVDPDGEILIGSTNRPESAEALKKLKEMGTGRAEEFIICFINKSVVIQANSTIGLEAAVDKFIADYCTTGKMMSDHVFVKDVKGQYPDVTLNGVNIGEYKIVIPKYNLSYLVMYDINDMIDSVRELSGYELSIVKDDTEVTDYEIVIGPANRDGVTAIADYDKYSVSTKGKKVYLNGGRNYSNAYAVRKFADALKVGDNTATESAGVYQEDDDSYKLVWGDEFEELRLDLWSGQNVNNGHADRVNGSGYGSWYDMDVVRTTREENLYVSDGKLYMVASYDDTAFYGSWLSTSNWMEFVYGYMEVSQRCADGQGIWHDFWTWSNDKGHLEFDIMEVWGPGNHGAAVLHEIVSGEGLAGGSEAQPVYSLIKEDKWYPGSRWNDELDEYKREESLWDDYHTFSCEWTENDVSFYRDNERVGYHCYTDPNLVNDHAYLYRKKHHLILSMLVGSNYDNEPDDSDSTRRPIIPGKGPEVDPEDYAYWTDGRSTTIIEYVQLFQKDGIKGQKLDFYR